MPNVTEILLGLVASGALAAVVGGLFMCLHFFWGLR